MKKIIAFVLSAVILLSVFSVGVFAENDDGFEDYEQHLYDALINCEEKVELAEYNVKAEDVSDFFNEIIQCYPEISFNIATITEDEKTYYDFKCYSYAGTGKAAYVEIGYNMGKDEYRKAVKLVEDSVKSILNKVKKLSDFEKALYIHDWICINFMYDYRLAENPGSENHDIIGFFKDGIGVCQSYAYTYMYMLRQVGVKSYYVISDTDNHGWNVVNIDDNWYHVDVTHDDPILGYEYQYDYIGEVRHDKFLLSDNEILADGEHDNFEYPFVEEKIVCNKYKGNDSWRTATTSVLNVNGYWYYLDNSKEAGGLMKTRDFKKVERVKQIGLCVEFTDKEGNSFEEYGWVKGNSIQSGYYTGLFEYNEHLFFTDAEKIYVYDTHHGVTNSLPIDRPDNMYYFGINMEGKTLTYFASESDLWHIVSQGSYTLCEHIKHFSTDWEIIKDATDNEDGEKVKYCYFCGEVVERQSIPSLLGGALMGDANGDGQTTTTDLALVKIFLANGNGEINMRADFNKDGIIDTRDLASLKLKLAGVN